MTDLFQMPVLGAVVGFTWWQWLLVVVLIGLIVFYTQMRKRQM